MLAKDVEEKILAYADAWDALTEIERLPLAHSMKHEECSTDCPKWLVLMKNMNDAKAKVRRLGDELDGLLTPGKASVTA